MPRDASSASDDEWPAGDPALAAFAEDLRMVASGPAPEPRPGLVAAMARGADVPTGSQPGRPKMLVKTVLGSLAAKVALGVGVAAASVGAAGATGVLPDQAQHAVASVVSATTPFVLPDPSTERPQVAADVPTSSTSTTLAEGTGDDQATEGQPDNHGACVSAVAQDKSGTGSHGKAVSTVARSDCGKTTTSSTVPGITTTSSTSSTSSTSTTSTTIGGANPGVTSGPGSPNSGKGNNGNGNGNQGKGSSGNGNGNGNGKKG